MENCTWNIIFLAFNIKDEYINLKDINKDAIKLGIAQFEKDVTGAVFSENVNINMLKFVSDSTKDIETTKGTATCYKNMKNEKGRNTLEEIGDPFSFDTHSKKDFKNYFDKVIVHKPSQKYFIVFLAHSNGPGFFEIKSGIHYLYLKMQDLGWAFKSSFTNKIDCFFALNCQMQSLESNFALKDSVEFLLGSQQPLFTDTISYSSLFEDLIYDTECLQNDFLFTVSTQMMFQKFIFDNHNTFLLRNDTSISTLSPFCLTLTKPSTTPSILYYVNLLFSYIYRDEIDGDLNKMLKRIIRNEDFTNEPYLDLGIAIKFCEDPSSSNLINIIDANTFFNKLKEIFDYQKHYFLSKSIDLLLKYMNNLIIFHMASGNSYQRVSKGPITSHFFPMGLGIFVVKDSEKSNKNTLNIFYDIFINKKNSEYSLDITNVAISKDASEKELSIIKMITDSNNYIKSAIHKLFNFRRYD